MSWTIATPNAMAALALAIKPVILGPPAAVFHLFQNDFVPAPESLPTDFVEATFDGYAPLTPGILFGPRREEDGSFTVYAFEQWKMTGNVTPNIIYGIYVMDSANNFLFAIRFDNPVPMQDQFSAVGGEISFGETQDGLAGGWVAT